MYNHCNALSDFVKVMKKIKFLEVRVQFYISALENGNICLNMITHKTRKRFLRKKHSCVLDVAKMRPKMTPKMHRITQA